MLKIPRTDLEEARRTLESLLSKLEKVLLKLSPGTSQHTLANRRIQALQIALELIRLEADGKERNPS